MDDSLTIFLVVVFVALAIGVGAVIHWFLCLRQREKEAFAQTPVPETRELQATVVDLCCAVRTIGYQTPKTVTLFAVTFETADGQHLYLQVPQEMYEGLEKGQTGLVTLVDGELYSFEIANI